MAGQTFVVAIQSSVQMLRCSEAKPQHLGVLSCFTTWFASTLVVLQHYKAHRAHQLLDVDEPSIQPLDLLLLDLLPLQEQQRPVPFLLRYQLPGNLELSVNDALHLTIRTPGLRAPFN